MNKAISILIASSSVLLTIGAGLYYYGRQQNAVPASSDELLGVSGGDKWLFAGVVLMILGGAVVLGAIKFWIGERRSPAGSFGN
jgi:hypothetical protein